jgi:16S rRNA (cytosine967-C5)-methyltransferase
MARREPSHTDDDPGRRAEMSAADVAELATAATRLYRRGLVSPGRLDSIVRDAIATDLRGSPRPFRGRVARLAQAMWRRRRLLDSVELVAPDRKVAHRDLPAFIALTLQAKEAGLATPPLPLPRPDRILLDDVVNDTLAHAGLAVRASLPDWLAERLQALGGEPLALASTTTPPTTLRANTLKCSREQLIASLAIEGIVAVACPRSPVGVSIQGEADVFRTAAFFDGLFEMQDEGSQLVALHTQAQPGERVVDGCAGAGGKSLALAAMMQNQGTLLALDVHGGRLSSLKQRARRAGVHNVRVVDLEEAPKQKKRLKGGCDLVVVDAPCSGTGVLRRNPDTGWRLSEGDVDRLVAIQRELLDTYAALVRPGGRLVYATCSLLPEENEGQVRAFLDRHPTFVADDAPLVLRPSPAAGSPDGFFAVTLRRP